MQVQERKNEFTAAGFELLAIGFSPADALAPLAEHLSWEAPFCSDEGRLVYGRLDIGRAGTLQVFNAGTRAIYRDAVASGERVQRPVEDIRQLGGDVLIVDGVARLLARPASPDDRPSVDELLAGARSLAAPSV
ncbi:MAG: hypothetical protein M3Q68_06380 [Actinomycetota bacterium]|nr:hypothetical protein [Actinomycetota bacterium]